MSAASGSNPSVPWWKEPTKDQWLAWWAAWAGWTLDAFDFTVFLLIMVPIAQEFHVPLTDVVAVFAITLWLRLIGAVASGWLADRVGRKIPLMISILWFSICNFIAGFSPTFAFLFFFRALLGIGMGAEWPAGAALAMESWPARSRGLMSAILQGSWSLGFLASSAAYGLLYSYIGWRGLLWMGILPALAVVWIRKYVKEPEIWLENRRKQRKEKREMRVPLLAIFKTGLIGNTLTACWWLASAMIVYYSIFGLFAVHLQKDLALSPGLVAVPLMISNAATFAASFLWGWMADKVGRRWSMIVPALIGLLLAPTYLLTSDYTVIAVGFAMQGFFAGAIYGQNPGYLSERFPTEVRATAAGFIFHQGAIFGSFVAPILTYLAVTYHVGFGIAMLVGTTAGLISFVMALLFGPETKGKVLVADLVVT